MAIALVGTPAGGMNVAGGNSITTSIAVDAAADCITVGAGGSNSVGRTVSGITYAASAMTRVTGCTVNRAGGHGVINADMFIKVAPATGSNNLVSSFNSVADELQHALAGWSGVDQTTPFVNGTNSNGTTSPSTCAVTNAAGDVAVGFGWFGMDLGSQLTPADTELFEQSFNVTCSLVYNTGTNPTLSWTNTNASKEYVVSAFSLNAAAGAAATPSVQVITFF